MGTSRLRYAHSVVWEAVAHTAIDVEETQSFVRILIIVSSLVEN